MPVPHVSFQAGETIFTVGDDATSMFTVLSGEVDLQINGRVVETVGENGFFGELSLVDHSPRSATAIAKTDCELAVLEEKNFLFMVQETPYFSLKVLRAVANRLRAMNKVVAA